MDVLIARQPILNRKLHTYGYELLFRDSLDNLFPDIDGDIASSTVLTNSFLSMGIETLTGGKKAFVNFTKNLMLKLMPVLFSPKILISELLEDIESDDDLIDAVTKMNDKGCHFALDDFIFNTKYETLIRLSEIIKIDIKQTPPSEIKPLLDRYSDSPLKFLAEKVETHEEYAEAMAMGFSYFQGYFFSKPEIIKQRSISPNKIKLLQIIRELNRDDADVGRLEEIIKTDVSISYQLLKYMKSAFYNLPGKITSIRGAIVFLGLNEVRKIVTLLVTAKLAESKPSELIRMSILRARLCELAGQTSGYHGDISELFLLGLFSMLDALLDTDMENVIDQLPLSDNLKNALINKEGEMADYLKLIICFETGHWDDCECLSETCRYVKFSLENYIEAISWADSFV